jgi:hypothetical protein
MADKIQAYKVSCIGGLDTNRDMLSQGELYPGSASQLINYEPSITGGYSRIKGYTNTYGTVPGGGSVLGVNISENINDGVFACRAPLSPSTDYFYRWSASTSTWVPITASAGVTMVGVVKVRFENLSWGVNKTVLVDGVNRAASYNGSTYTQLASPSPAAPKFVTQFANHLFLGGDASEVYNLYFSAPLAETDFSPANGAGVINVGFPIVQIKGFREFLYIFGKNSIKRLSGTSIADFRLEEVTSNLGCVASDSVVELSGNLIFLSNEGFRPISGTDRIGDVELATLSKQIQGTVTLVIDELLLGLINTESISMIVYNKKSQFRLMIPTEGSFGFLGGARKTDRGSSFEYSLLFDFVVSCATSGYIGTEEIILHGDLTGKVHKQETGTSFDGRDILSIYQTPYFYFEDPTIRKNFYNITTFLRSEGNTNIAFSVSYDFDDSARVFNPANYAITTVGAAAFYNTAVYDSGVIFDGNPAPVVKTNIAGSGLSVSFKYVTNDKNPSHNIQGLVLNFSFNDRR